jgi:hypothetical protein
MLVGLTAVLAAQAPKVNVKFGLWEMTSVTQMSGDIPMDMSKMTPEQQAQMKAAMAGMMNKPMTNTAQNCLTKEKFDQGKFAEDEKDCKQTVITNTETTYSFKQVCTGDQARTVTMTFTAPSPTSVNGKFEGTVSQQGKTMNISGTMTGKYIGADCGKIK